MCKSWIKKWLYEWDGLQILTGYDKTEQYKNNVRIDKNISNNLEFKLV